MGKLSSLISCVCLAGLVTLSLGIAPGLAQNCTEGCRSGEIQFTPGDRITVQVMNLSNVTIGVEQPPMVGPRTLLPGTTTDLGFGWGTQPNLSIFFWALEDQPIRVLLGRPEPTTLNVEIYSAPSEPSDRSIYIENDGRVTIR